MKVRGILPGFGLTFGVTIFYLSLIVLLPLSTIFAKTATMGWGPFWETVTSPRVVASFRLTFGASALAALINSIFGFLVAWVLVRYSFPGRKIVDAMVDMPFALPTAVAGISLTAVYAPTGWIGAPLAKWGIQAAFAPLGVVIALTFIGLPFVVRALQPVLEATEPDMEEAAMTLGASLRRDRNGGGNSLVRATSAFGGRGIGADEPGMRANASNKTGAAA